MLRNTATVLISPLSNCLSQPYAIPYISELCLICLLAISRGMGNKRDEELLRLTLSTVLTGRALGCGCCAPR